MRITAMVMVAMFAGLVGQLGAGTLYWDGDGTGASGNPPTSGVGGDGTWDNSTSNWWNGSSYQTWTPGDTADFRVSNGTITLGDTIQLSAIIDNIDMTFADSGANTLDFSAGAGSFSRNVNQNASISTRIQATSGFTFDSNQDNSRSTAIGGTADVNEFSGTLNIHTLVTLFRDNVLGGAVGTAAHLNMNDSGIVSFIGVGNDGTFASMTGVAGSRIFLDGLYDGSLTLTGAGLTASDVRTFSGTLDNDNPATDALMSIIKQGEYIQALDGDDKFTAGVDVQEGTLRFADGIVTMPTLTLGTNGVATLDGGTTRVETLTFSSPGGGVVDFTIGGGVLALTNSWNATSLSAIADSSFAVDGVESTALQFDAGTGDYSGYTLIRGVPPAGTVVSIQ